jgi:hypothetical protein
VGLGRWIGAAAAVALLSAGASARADEPKGETKTEPKGDAKAEPKGDAKAEPKGDAKAEHGDAKAEHGEHAGHGEHGEHGEHEGRLEVSFTERPLTMPRLILNLEGELGVEHVDPATTLGFTLSGRFGITDDLEVNAIFAPLEVGPYGSTDPSKFAYANPEIGATYRFLRGRFELGATLGVTVVHQRYDNVFQAPAWAVQTGAIVEPGAVFRFHITKEALLFGGVYIPIEGGSVDPALGGENSFGVGFRIPVSFAYDIMEPLHVGVTTGVGLVSFSAPTNGSVAENLYIPIGAFAGYAIAGKNGPILDIDPFFTWPYLLTPSSESHGLTAAQATRPGDFSVGVSLGGFLYF